MYWCALCDGSVTASLMQSEAYRLNHVRDDLNAEIRKRAGQRVREMKIPFQVTHADACKASAQLARDDVLQVVYMVFFDTSLPRPDNVTVGCGLFDGMASDAVRLLMSSVMSEQDEGKKKAAAIEVAARAAEPRPIGQGDWCNMPEHVSAVALVRQRVRSSLAMASKKPATRVASISVFPSTSSSSSGTPSPMPAPTPSPDDIKMRECELRMQDILRKGLRIRLVRDLTDADEKSICDEVRRLIDWETNPPASARPAPLPSLTAAAAAAAAPPSAGYSTESLAQKRKWHEYAEGDRAWLGEESSNHVFAASSPDYAQVGRFSPTYGGGGRDAGPRVAFADQEHKGEFDYGRQTRARYASSRDPRVSDEALDLSEDGENEGFDSNFLDLTTDELRKIDDAAASQRKEASRRAASAGPAASASQGSVGDSKRTGAPTAPFEPPIAHRAVSRDTPVAHMPPLFPWSASLFGTVLHDSQSQYAPRQMPRHIY